MNGSANMGVDRYKPLLILLLSFLVISCSPKEVDDDSKEIAEMKGYIVTKELDTLLVVPTIDRTVVERVLKGELDEIAVAQDHGGIYFSVSKETYEQAKVGNHVLVKYDPSGDVKDSSPPIRTAESVEFIN